MPPVLFVTTGGFESHDEGMVKENTGTPDPVVTLRIGHGYDIHRIEDGRKLVLGGVTFPTDFGLDGHSDADCLTHAICDALLGAAGLPDIGQQFPNTDPAYKDADSQTLLTKVVELIGERGFAVVNVDASIVAERPKIGPFVPAMKQILSGNLGVGVRDINIKATTNEKVGDIGRGLAIAAHAVCLLSQKDR